MSLNNNSPAQPCGHVLGLFRKERHGTPALPPGPHDGLACIAGFGIEGDVHAHRLSPRQILVTLQAELDALQLAPGALHENLVISCNAPDLFRPGTALVTEHGVEIRLTMFCEPCKRIAPLGHDLASLIDRRGVLGSIQSAGRIMLGDAITLVPGRYQALPESAYQKFRDFVATVPAGKVVRYAEIAIAIGVDRSFVRAVPGYIKRSIGGNLPLHRIVTGTGELPAYIAGQAGMLAREGVALCGARGAQSRASVALDAHLWEG